MDAFARPVRSVPNSLRKSSTAFSIRVRAWAIASFVVAIVVIFEVLNSKSVVFGSEILVLYLFVTGTKCFFPGPWFSVLGFWSRKKFLLQKKLQGQTDSKKSFNYGLGSDSD